MDTYELILLFRIYLKIFKQYPDIDHTKSNMLSVCTTTINLRTYSVKDIKHFQW